MAWNIAKVYPSPIQRRVLVTNDAADATVSTDFREADKIARTAIASPVLATKGYGLTGRAYRVYVSQNY